MIVVIVKKLINLLMNSYCKNLTCVNFQKILFILSANYLFEIP